MSSGLYGALQFRRPTLILTVHGEDSDDEAVCIGGLADDALAAITRAPTAAAGFTIEKHSNPQLQGESRDNICNQGQRRAGVQLELSSGRVDLL
jgi:phage replication-related protein YjqB (UPF0714/DUF867 family)